MFFNAHAKGCTVFIFLWDFDSNSDPKNPDFRPKVGPCLLDLLCDSVLKDVHRENLRNF